MTAQMHPARQKQRIMVVAGVVVLFRDYNQ
jgi:hypothetical protein